VMSAQHEHGGPVQRLFQLRVDVTTSVRDIDLQAGVGALDPMNRVDERLLNVDSFGRNSGEGVSVGGIVTMLSSDPRSAASSAAASRARRPVVPSVQPKTILS
jgi:hypothetical protein